MTLVIGLMNRTFAAQVSDRRISDNGRPVDEESNKAVLVTCRDGRFLVGYSGLATFETFKTKQWLVDVLFEIAPPDFTAAGMARRFVERATYDFANIATLRKVSARKKRLTVMWTGFRMTPHQPAVALLVSNFQNFDEGIDEPEARESFRFVRYFQERKTLSEQMTWVQRIGRWDKFQGESEDRLRRLLLDGGPAQASVDTAVEIIRDIATRYPKAGVGSQISSIVLPADPTKPPMTTYHTSAPSHDVYMPSVVLATGPGNHYAVMDSHLQAVDPTLTTPLVVPKVGRNHPCPCRSGEKYKRCHGNRSPGFAAA